MKFFRRYPVVGLAIALFIICLPIYFAGFRTAAQIIVTVMVGLFCLYTFVDMLREILRGHFGLDILALVAMVSTLATQEYWASLVIVIMLSGGEALEDYAARRASSELTSLLDRTPTDAHVVESGDTTKDVPAGDVRVGEIVIVRPAEVVPIDGILLTSLGSFDMSSITGESLPVTFVSGKEVPSGAVNGATAVKLRVSKPASESQYQQIVRLVEEAQRTKAPIVRLADRFAIPFTAISLLIAGIAWWISGDPVRFAEVLVLATPCPLLIAAPVAFMGGMSRAAKAGVVVKGGAVLERAWRVRSIAFDKTGTLTNGEPEVVRTVGDERVLRVAASAEQYSTHVLAEGIRKAGSHLELPAADSAEEVSAQGVIAQVEGKEVKVGRLNFAANADPSVEPIELGAGEAAVYVSEDGEYLGAIVLADTVREEGPAVVAWLRTQGVEAVSMVTGDSPRAANAVATELGITDVHASLLPVDKVNIVHGMAPALTMMVGDGINDAPVLAAADIGVAMGAKGSTAAGEAADAVILRDTLVGVPTLLWIAKHTLNVALTAIWLGVILSVALMLIATTGVIPAIAGALAQEVLDLIAILYALRALTGKHLDLSVPKASAERGEPLALP